MNVSARSRNPWPIAIIAFFAVFISFIVAYTVFASRQQMDLVRRDYYDDEIRYQQQLDRVTRTQPVADQVGIAYDAQQEQVTLTLPPAHAGHAVGGRVRFYRPSDAGLDVEVPLAVSRDGVQRIDARGLRAGQWKVRLYWTVEGREYFVDRAIVVGAHLGSISRRMHAS